MKAVLHLTKNCNLRCKYCYAPDKVSEEMSDEVARKAVDLVINQSEGSACVSYFGGEPLLMFDRIRALTRYAIERGAEAGTEMHFRLSTNGTLFTEDQLAFCRDNNILFAVSLDGDQRAHDTMRVLPSGKGSFALVDEKLDLILRFNPYTVVTSVITPGTVDRLLPSIEYMWGRGLRFVVHQPDYTHPDWSPEVMARLQRSYEQLADFYLDRARAGEHFHLSLFDDKLKTHASSPIVLGEMCDFGARKFSVAADGRLFPCVQFISDRPDAASYCIGDVDEGFNDQRQALIAENKRARPECEGCALSGRCSNYCGCVNWQMTGELCRVPPVLCAHEQMLIPIADRIGNELWSEKNAYFLKKHYKKYDALFDYPID